MLGNYKFNFNLQNAKGEHLSSAPIDNTPLTHLQHTTGATALHMLIDNDDVKSTIWILENGRIKDVDTTDNRGLTPLQLAVARRQPKTVAALVAAGADADQELSPLLDTFLPGKKEEGETMATTENGESEEKEGKKKNSAARGKKRGRSDEKEGKKKEPTKKKKKEAEDDDEDKENKQGIANGARKGKGKGKANTNTKGTKRKMEEENEKGKRNGQKKGKLENGTATKKKTKKEEETKKEEDGEGSRRRSTRRLTAVTRSKIHEGIMSEKKEKSIYAHIAMNNGKDIAYVKEELEREETKKMKRKFAEVDALMAKKNKKDAETKKKNEKGKKKTKMETKRRKKAREDDNRRRTLLHFTTQLYSADEGKEMLAMIEALLGSFFLQLHHTKLILFVQ